MWNNYYFQPVATKNTGVYDMSTALLLSCLAKELVDMPGDPREKQWFHQRLSAVVRGNAASILACVQVCGLILAILIVLTSVAARHLPLFNE